MLQIQTLETIAMGIFDILWCIHVSNFCQVFAVHQLQSLTIAIDEKEATLTYIRGIGFVEVKKCLLHFCKMFICFKEYISIVQLVFVDYILSGNIKIRRGSIFLVFLVGTPPPI